MKIRIEKGIARGTVCAPPSKSMAHRLLICAGLSDGECIVHGISDSEDMLATMDCLRALGMKCEKEGDTVRVSGIDIRKAAAPKQLNCRESGSTLRFFIPIALMTEKEAVLTGSGRLLERPLSVYEELFRQRGITFCKTEREIRICGSLKSGDFELDGNVSSQFATGILFALPLLEGDSRITLRPPVESRSYINMTLSALKLFGVEAGWQEENVLYIKGNQRYHAEEVFVEGDYSNAAFFEALNLLGGQVIIKNLRKDSLQGDRVYEELFEALKRPGAELDLSDCPDLGPVLFATAAAKQGGKFTGTSRLKIKESNRGEAMAEELRKFGVTAEVLENEVIVSGQGLREPKEVLDGHNDHRIVMSEAVLLTQTGGVIDGAEAVSKSFPDFFEKLASLGIEVEKIEN